MGDLIPYPLGSPRSMHSFKVLKSQHSTLLCAQGRKCTLFRITQRWELQGLHQTTPSAIFSREIPQLDLLGFYLSDSDLGCPLRFHKQETSSFTNTDGSASCRACLYNGHMHRCGYGEGVLTCSYLPHVPLHCVGCTSVPSSCLRDPWGTGSQSCLVTVLSCQNRDRHGGDPPGSKRSYLLILP